MYLPSGISSQLPTVSRSSWFGGGADKPWYKKASTWIYAILAVFAAFFVYWLYVRVKTTEQRKERNARTLETVLNSQATAEVIRKVPTDAMSLTGVGGIFK